MNRLVNNPSCLIGSQDFLRMMKKVGFTDPRVVSSSPINMKNKEIEEKLGPIKFYSKTYRAFKLASLEDK